MELPNPNDGKPYGRVLKDTNGEDVWGIRNEHTPNEEIVHIPTGQSNQRYWKPEVVLNPEGCQHEFFITDIGRREVECRNCHFATSFIVGVNYSDDPPQFTLKGKKYPISL